MMGVVSSKKKCCEELKSLQTCCGCSACAILCPVDAINMNFNDGTYSPSIKYELCIDCGLCLKNCQALSQDKKSNVVGFENAECYVAVAKDKTVLSKSSSGGLAYSLSRKAIEDGMAVCGACYCAEHERCEHIVCGSIEDLSRTQGSKYLQSANFEAFNEILEYDSGLIVGTPCQIAGLSRILESRGKRGSFILVDIFCHGVPNEMLWENHLAWLIAKRKIKPKAKVSFRENDRFRLQIDTYKAWYNEDAFYTFFLRGWLYNKACYLCQYRRASYADIRLGDLLVEKYKSLSYSPSCVVVLSDTGREFIESSKDLLELYPEPYETIDSIQAKQSEPAPTYYDEVLAKLRCGTSPESIIKRTMILGRLKSFLKHNILLRKKHTSDSNLNELAMLKQQDCER